jgi:hypothetical protein
VRVLSFSRLPTKKIRKKSADFHKTRPKLSPNAHSNRGAILPSSYSIKPGVTLPAQRRAFSDKVRHLLLNCSTAQLSREARPPIKIWELLGVYVTKWELRRSQTILVRQSPLPPSFPLAMTCPVLSLALSKVEGSLPVLPAVSPSNGVHRRVEGYSGRGPGVRVLSFLERTCDCPMAPLKKSLGI